MMRRMIRIFTDPRCLEHAAPRGYPERPDRLSGIVEHLRARSWPFAEPREASPFAREAVLALTEILEDLAGTEGGGEEV